MKKENSECCESPAVESRKEEKSSNSRLIACHALTMAAVMVVSVAIVTGVVVLALYGRDSVAKALSVALIVGIGCFCLVRLERKS